MDRAGENARSPVRIDHAAQALSEPCSVGFGWY